MIPKSNTIEAAALIEKVLDERYHPCNPAAIARAGYEAAYREFMKISETQSSDKDPDCVKASSEVTSILVDPKATTKGATLFTGDGIEDVEESSYYRVLLSRIGV